MEDTMRLYRIVCLTAMLFVLWGCGEVSGPVEAFRRSPDLRGTILSRDLVSQGSLVQNLFVKGVPESDTDYSEAFVGLTVTTTIFWQIGTSYRLGSIDDLQIGQRVAVFLTGPRGASAPITGTAAEIIILEQ